MQGRTNISGDTYYQMVFICHQTRPLYHREALWRRRKKRKLKTKFAMSCRLLDSCSNLGAYICHPIQAEPDSVSFLCSTLSVGVTFYHKFPWRRYFGPHQKWRVSEHFFITPQCSRFHGSMTKYFSSEHSCLLPGQKKMQSIHNFVILFFLALLISFGTQAGSQCQSVIQNLSFVTVKNYQQTVLIFDIFSHWYFHLKILPVIHSALLLWNASIFLLDEFFQIKALPWTECLPLRMLMAFYAKFF